MTVSHRIRLAAVIGAVAVWCLTADRTAGGDPMLALELAGGVLVGAWATVALRSIRLGHLLAGELTVRSRPAIVQGIRCNVISGGGHQAFVLGAVRPRIWIGDGLLAALDPGELRAVLLHEDHHRRTFAPLRTAALEAWLTLFGWSPHVHSLVTERLVDLEELADVDALEQGVSPATLASALLKGEPSRARAAAGLSRAADRRIVTLLELAAGRPGTGSRKLPYEWLPFAVVAAVALGCHLPSIPSLG